MAEQKEPTRTVVLDRPVFSGKRDKNGKPIIWPRESKHTVSVSLAGQLTGSNRAHLVADDEPRRRGGKGNSGKNVVRDE